MHVKNYLSAETTTSTTTPTTASSPGKFITIIINFMEINLLYFYLSLSDKRAYFKQTNLHNRAVVTGPAGPAAAGPMFGRLH